MWQHKEHFERRATTTKMQADECTTYSVLVYTHTWGKRWCVIWWFRPLGR
jgi:hypothetical protein